MYLNKDFKKLWRKSPILRSSSFGSVSMSLQSLLVEYLLDSIYFISVWIETENGRQNCPNIEGDMWTKHVQKEAVALIVFRVSAIFTFALRAAFTFYFDGSNREARSEMPMARGEHPPLQLWYQLSEHACQEKVCFEFKLSFEWSLHTCVQTKFFRASEIPSKVSL